MRSPCPIILAVVAIGASLANPSTVCAGEKRKPVATPSPEVAWRVARSQLNEACMTNEEAQAVASVLARRREQQDQETKRYELFKFHRDILLAKAAAPSITIFTGSQDVGGAETPASHPQAVMGRHAAKALDSVAAFATIAVHDRMNALSRPAAPESESRAGERGRTTGSLDAEESDPPPVDNAVRQLSAYPASYFRKLATEKDLHRLEDMRARKDMLDFIAGELKGPSTLLLQNADDRTTLPSESSRR